MRPVALATLALLASCSQPAVDKDEADPNQKMVRQEDPPASLPAVNLIGEWRVAGIDGQPFDKPYAISLSVDDKRIWWEPSCAGQFRYYDMDGARFSSWRDEGPGGPICTIPVLDEVPVIFTALEVADTIETTAANGVRIHGGGHSLTLFSQ